MAEGKTVQLFEPALPELGRQRLDLLKCYSSAEFPGTSDLRGYLHILQKRCWTILAVFLAVLTVTLIATLKEKPVYEARALLEIGQENPNVVSVQDLFQMENLSDDYLETQYKILGSDTLARDVVSQLHLDRDPEFVASRFVWPWQQRVNADSPSSDDSASNPAVEQRAVQRFEQRLLVMPVQRSRLVRVTFDSQDPRLAAQIVNTLAESYIQENLQSHWEATQKASAWLSDQLDGLRIKLEKSEDALQQYAQANNLLFLEDDKGQVENIVDERLRQIQDELTQAQADLYKNESLYRLVEAGDYGALPGVFDNPVMQNLTDKLADLERQQAELAPDFKPAFPKMKQIQSEIDRTNQNLQQERAEAAQHIADEYLAAVRRTALVQQAFDAQQKEANLVAEKSVEYTILKREADSNKQLYEGLLQRLKEAGVSAGLKASNIRVVDPAEQPTSPITPRIPLNLSLGLLLGLSAGVGIAFLQERMDSSLKTSEDIEHFLHLPSLALIPSRNSAAHRKGGYSKPAPAGTFTVAGSAGLTALKKELDSKWPRVDAVSLERSALSEAFRNLRTSVLLSTAGRPPRSLVFISAEPREGKTTICGNLAISLAQLGKRVLIVDADMRRPSLHDFFDVEGAPGLVDYLTGEEDWRGFTQPTLMKGLHCMTCGPEPPNPSELLSSERMQNLIVEAMKEYDFVLVDSPPLLNMADGRILTALVEGTILVVRGGSTPRELVRRAQGYITGVGARLIGVVLNDLDLRRDGEFYAAYAVPRPREAKVPTRARAR